MLNGDPRYSDTGEQPYRSGWVLLAGVAFGGLTLFFFMALVLAATFGKEVPPSSRFLVVVVLAFGAALSSAFIGGGVAAKGQLPIPGLQNHPVEFSAVGGIAVLVVVLLLGNATFTQPQAGGSWEEYLPQ